MRSQSLVVTGNAENVLSRRDPRVKLILLVGFISTLSLWKAPSGMRLACTFIILVALTLIARLPLLRIFVRGFLVLPFVGFFALVLYVSGQPGRALLILAKSYLSTWSVLLLVSSTSPGQLVAAANDLHVPRLLSEVTQLTFRYIFVLREEAAAMQVAFRARAGRTGTLAVLASSGMIAGLFMRSQERAERIYQAMLSRGYTGHQQTAHTLIARPIDYLLLAFGLLVLGSTLFL